MAFWKRYPHGIVVFANKNGKQRRLPREETKTLDSLSDDRIDAWVANYTLAHEKSKPQIVELTDDKILKHVDSFCAYLLDRKKSPKTVKQHRFHLTRYCLPYFVNHLGLRLPDQWKEVSVRLLPWLTEKQIGPRTLNLCNVSMRVFWRWLVEEGIATGTGHLLLRNAVVDKNATPLAFTVTPDDIRTHFYGAQDLKLMALIGFFFSLRPQELVALRPCDFRAGSQAEELGCCQAMAPARTLPQKKTKPKPLFSRLAVHVHRQCVGKDPDSQEPGTKKTIKGKVHYMPPKAGSKGWVACFDEKAAREIVRLLQKRKPQELLFASRLDFWFKAWRIGGYKGLSLKDLRRASIYWLGHSTDLPFHSLKNHARHSDPNTTALYTRRPEDEATEFEKLDLDA